MCFFLFVIGKCAKYQADSGYILPIQTGFVDSLGYSERMFNVYTLGPNISKKKLLPYTYLSHHLYIPDQPWLNFIHHYYHFIPPMKVEFTFEKVCKFVPPSLSLGHLNVSQFKSFQIKIQNTMSFSSLKIISIWSISRDVHVPVIDRIDIAVSQSCQFPVYICPTAVGEFSTIIYIKSDRGVFPYHIRYSVNENTEALVPSIFYNSMSSQENVTFKILWPNTKEKVQITYDGAIFDSSKSSFNSRLLQLSPQMARQGYYTTFVNAYSKTTAKTFPLSLFISYKHLIPIDPIIYVDTATSKDDVTESDIRIVNPTNMAIDIIMAAVLNQLGNVRIAHLQYPIRCEPVSHTTIGKIVIDGSVPGEIDTSLQIQYVITDGSIHYLTIPVKGFVLYGELTPSESNIAMVQSTPRGYQFNFTNNFKVPVAVLGMYISSPSFQLSDFVPFLLQPGQTSKNTTIQFAIIPPPDKEADIIILTNATKLIIPVKLYSGSIFISLPSKRMTPRDSLHINLGEIQLNSIRKINLSLTNPNPDPFYLGLIKTSHTNEVIKETPGICDNPIGRTFMPFSTTEFEIAILFTRADRGRRRNDTIVFSSDQTMQNSFPVTIEWTPIFRSEIYDLRIDPGLSPQTGIIFGNTYKAKLFANISQTVKITKVISDCESISSSPEFFNKTIEAYNEAQIADLNISFDSRLAQMTYNPIGRPPFLISPEEYDILTVVGTKLSLNVFVFDDNRDIFKLTFSYRCRMPTFNDTSLQLEDTFIGSMLDIDIPIVNNFDLPIQYIFILPHDKDMAVTAGGLEYIVPPHTTMMANFSLRWVVLGWKVAKFHILTNISRSFDYVISTRVVEQTFDEERLTMPPNTTRRILMAKWGCILDHKNNGTATLVLNDVESNTWGIEARLITHVIKPGEIIRIELNITPMYFIFTKQNISLTLKTRITEFIYRSSMPFSPTEKAFIRKLRDCILMLMIVISVAPVIRNFKKIFFRMLVVNVIAHIKQRYVEKTIKQLSKSIKKNVAIQTDETELPEMRRCGGILVNSPNPPKNFSESMSTLSSLIAEVNAQK